MVDYSDDEVKKAIKKAMKITGWTEEEIIKEYEYAVQHKKYVKIVKGRYMGTVGVVYPIQEICPTVTTVFLPDGSEIWCPRYDTELKEITEEEYKEASNEVSN